MLESPDDNTRCCSLVPREPTAALARKLVPSLGWCVSRSLNRTFTRSEM